MKLSYHIFNFEIELIGSNTFYIHWIYSLYLVKFPIKLSLKINDNFKHKLSSRIKKYKIWKLNHSLSISSSIAARQISALVSDPSFLDFVVCIHFVEDLTKFGLAFFRHGSIMGACL